MMGQSIKESNHMRHTDSSGMNGQEPAETFGFGGCENSADPGQAFPVEWFANHRGTPTRSPSGTNRRALRKSRFIQKDEPSVQAQGVFFTRGQRYRTQRAITSSSLSLARRAGRCRLQPIWPIILQTWGREYLTPQVFQITWAIRSRVHNSVEKPHAVAPSTSAAATCSRSTKSKRGFRPARPAPRSPCSPSLRQAAYQRLAVCRLTAKRWTTSDWGCPWVNSFAAVIRRAFNAPKSRRGRMNVFMLPLYHTGEHLVTIL